MLSQEKIFKNEIRVIPGVGCGRNLSDNDINEIFKTKREHMAVEIITIRLKTILASVNCYLIKLNSGFILIDTGWTKSRTILEGCLDKAGCKPGDLKLIVLTHGDFDHIGNCLFIRNKFKSKIAMHNDDLGMAERGDMFWNRKKNNLFMRTLSNVIFKLSSSDRFSPDIYLKDGDDLAEYGLRAKVISLPGHSTGSIGIITDDGNLFCGDLFENIRKPSLSSIIDNSSSAKLSADKLSDLNIGTVFPGHGKSFLMKDFKKK
ncbi:MAG: MBL fold metallo-hydrolase [Fibrobacterota bacterium]|nr:MBL fold metallo-hydrolase [Chitinispirillaceae bacterium]